MVSHSSEYEREVAKNIIMEPISSQFEQVGRMLGTLEAKCDELTDETVRLKLELVTKDEIIRRMKKFSELLVKASGTEPAAEPVGW